MQQYEDVRIRLRLLAPLGTIPTSDTLFGHLCWQEAHRGGPEAVDQFLQPFRQGEPPFVLSDAFPAGLLPRPLLPLPSQPAVSSRDYARLKNRQKAPFVTVEDFLRLCEDPQAAVDPRPSPWQTAQIPHAAIDRRIDTTGGEEYAGRFYLVPIWFLPEPQLVDIYCRVRPPWLDRLVDLLEVVGRIGFGRDKSVGLGRFSLTEVSPWPHFRLGQGGSAVVSLSTLMPAATDPTDGHWQLRVKHGFLGEQASANPFKRPLIQLEPGAVFALKGRRFPAFLGRLVPAVAPGMPQAVQCGYALTVPCRWPLF